jgi:TusA-related sulfurtransferase
VGVRKTETALIIWSARSETSGSQAPGEDLGSKTPGTAGNSASVLGADAFYDAGTQGCAGGPLDEIARMLRRLQPGQTLEVRATDAGVAVDLPAWCRMTGHALVEHRDDRYLIRRKG